MDDYQPGDVITARTWRSGDRTILVRNRTTDEPRPGFDGVLARVEDGMAVPVVHDGVSEVWGYDFQITGIVMRAAVAP